MNKSTWVQGKQVRYSDAIKFLTTLCTFRDDIAARIEGETRQKIDAMNKNVSANKDHVISDVLERIISDVKPQLHKNLRL